MGVSCLLPFISSPNNTLSDSMLVSQVGGYRGWEGQGGGPAGAPRGCRLSALDLGADYT